MPENISIRTLVFSSVWALCTTVPTLAAVEATMVPPPNPAGFRLINISLDMMTAVGGSTARDEDIEPLFSGHHDPHQRGFNLQNVELALSGAVDPYFQAQAYIVGTLEGFEIEGAFAETTSLPAGLQIKGGYFLTEFGRTNPSHPHTNAWLTKPIVATRFFGADGTRAGGVRLAWLPNTPWYNRFLVSVQNANDETAASFRGVVDEDDDSITIGGRSRVSTDTRSAADLLWMVRWQSGIDIDAWTLLGGVSALVGPNATSTDARTSIVGIDVLAKWTGAGARQGFPFFKIEGEAMWRDFAAEADADLVLPATTLQDSGAYMQAEWGFRPGWAVGLRGEILTGSGGDDRSDDPQRDDRVRIAPMVSWNPSHFSRLRLEYDYDRFDRPTSDGDTTAHSVWLGLEVLIGAHPAHSL